VKATDKVGGSLLYRLFPAIIVHHHPEYFRMVHIVQRFPFLSSWKMTPKIGLAQSHHEY
jgi:hypothetical protein